jgi:hypothetical protein
VAGWQKRRCALVELDTSKPLERFLEHDAFEQENLKAIPEDVGLKEF